MTVFEYTALDKQGKKTKGSIDAENIRAARQRLRAQGVFTTDIKEGDEAVSDKSRDIKKYFQARRVPLSDLAVATRQLATLENAGLPIVSALQALAEQTELLPLRRILSDVRDKVVEGSSLAKALSAYPKTFPKLYINMISSGEASGTLGRTLANIADYLESQIELRQKLRKALTYPVIMLVICVLVVVALLTFVVPGIVQIFQKQGATLPLPTQILIGISDFLISYWYLVIIIIIAAMSLLGWYYRQTTGRERIDLLLLRLPIFGPIYAKVATARVSKTLSSLLASGVGLLNALDITRNLMNNVHIARTLEEAKEGVREGKSLAKEITRGGFFPPLLGHMIAVGEKSGELESMLQKIGDAYEKEVKSTLDSLTSLIEPVMMVVVGGIVFAIVISVLLPMADLIDVVQQ